MLQLWALSKFPICFHTYAPFPTFSYFPHQLSQHFSIHPYRQLPFSAIAFFGNGFTFFPPRENFFFRFVYPPPLIGRSSLHVLTNTNLGEWIWPMAVLLIVNVGVRRWLSNIILNCFECSKNVHSKICMGKWGSYKLLESIQFSSFWWPIYVHLQLPLFFTYFMSFNSCLLVSFPLPSRLPELLWRAFFWRVRLEGRVQRKSECLQARKSEKQKARQPVSQKVRKAESPKAQSGKRPECGHIRLWWKEMRLKAINQDSTD